MQRLKDIVKTMLYRAGYYHLIRLQDGRRTGNNRLLILTYHNISDGKEFFLKEHPFKVRPVITTRQFEAHLRVLKQEFCTLRLKDAVLEIKENEGPKRDLVVITFDDGYQSFYNLAFPLLKKYDLPATVFLPTDFINGRMIFWWDKLSQMLSSDDIEKVSRSALLPIIGEKLVNKSFKLRRDLRKRMNFLVELESYLIGLEDGLIEERVRELQDIFCPDAKMDAFGEALPLTWEQIKKLSDSNIEFGSHTCSHVNLRSVPPEKIEKEIVCSKREIENQTGSRVNCFAYPYGTDLQASEQIKSVLVKHQFICACSALPGINCPGTDPYLLRREFLPWTDSEALNKRELILDFARGKAVLNKPVSL